jgi:thiamine-phosphate pyrophosphorylase
MASASDRESLARAAYGLNASAGRKDLPPLILMTDENRVPDPVAVARHLPPGSAVIVRHTNARARAELAQALMRIARRFGLSVLIAGDPSLAAAVGATGLHLPEARAGEAAHWRALRPSWLITVAAHSLRALNGAYRAGADAALLAPVFATASHPGREPLGALRARVMAAHAALPVYALGGINGKTVGRLKDAPFAGIAAIEGVLAD